MDESASADRRFRVFVALLALLSGGFSISAAIMLVWSVIPYRDSLAPVRWLFEPLALLVWSSAFALVGAALYLNTGLSPFAIVRAWFPLFSRGWHETPPDTPSASESDTDTRKPFIDKSRPSLLAPVDRSVGAARAGLELPATPAVDQIEVPVAPKASRTPASQCSSVASAQVANTLTRLRTEVDALGRRANINLILGIAITATGMTALFVYVWNQPTVTTTTTWVEVSGYFIPRLSLVIVIEIFAYFFLQLYKSDLHDMKYYQNELTNFESKILALSVATEVGDKKSASVALLTLASTERNFVLKKGETTVELERAKVERSQIPPAFTNAMHVLLEAGKQKTGTGAASSQS